jgi:hypothetical protein
MQFQSFPLVCRMVRCSFSISSDPGIGSSNVQGFKRPCYLWWKVITYSRLSMIARKPLTYLPQHFKLGLAISLIARSDTLSWWSSTEKKNRNRCRKTTFISSWSTKRTCTLQMSIFWKGRTRDTGLCGRWIRSTSDMPGRTRSGWFSHGTGADSKWRMMS